VPTLARDVPGLRDSIRSGETGWLVPDGAAPDVVRRLADALEDALVAAADPAVRLLRAEACSAWAHKFDWSQMRRNACDLTASLLGSADAQPDRQPRDARVAV
jgi:glycosyltransferase involved in cell wall biosynthesis